jgi:hypothetical protein
MIISRLGCGSEGVAKVDSHEFTCVGPSHIEELDE